MAIGKKKKGRKKGGKSGGMGMWLVVGGILAYVLSQKPGGNGGGNNDEYDGDTGGNPPVDNFRVRGGIRAKLVNPTYRYV